MIDRQTGYRGSNSMREMVQDNNFLLHVISRFDIAYGFGDETIQKVCEENGVHTATFLAVCNLISGYPYDVESASLESLVNYLRHAHRSITEITLPHIRHHLMEGVVHSPDNKVTPLLIRFFDEYTAEVRQHMAKEDSEIFAYAGQLIAGEKPDGLTLADFVSGHEPMSEKLHELKDIFIYHYRQRDNDMLSSVLFDIILCERDLDTHFEVENRLLVPAVKAAERNCKVAKRQTAENPKSVTVLGEREREIIHYIAKGMTNKQIADALYLSTHTVATHRRNICAKLDIHSASGLTLYAIVHGLIDLNEISF
ncbi:MAG: LuxR C-terminal-related transcriptional regulator [Muribaculaceae bacterium]|nr:LuxR C-terminal-related transcriptional regulator [Muribaculaceae bacterium]